jgi:hypothetical protein
MIKGITVILYERKQIGVDELNDAVYTETPVPVKNVLVLPVDTKEIVNSVTLEGKKAVYELCLPKGDAHEWENCRVSFYGEDWIAFGLPREYIEANVPLSWNRKVKVARYE